MRRGPESDDESQLEVIDLESEVEPGSPAVAIRPYRRRVGWGVVAIAVVAAGALVFATAHHDHARSAPVRDDSSGRFFPNLRGSDATRLVLPSGDSIVLSGDLERTMGGLGAEFAGGLGSVNFRINHGDASTLFASASPGPIRRAIAVAGGDARSSVVADYGGRLAVLSTGDWTLVAFLSDDEDVAATQLHQLASWHLRASPVGAVVEGGDAAVGDASVVLRSAPGHTGRQVEFTADNCAGTALPTETQLGDVATGRWCENGVYVRISGPASYVEHALATLRVQVDDATHG